MGSIVGKMSTYLTLVLHNSLNRFPFYGQSPGGPYTSVRETEVPGTKI